MSRINTPVSIDKAPEASQQLLEDVNAQLGQVPNMFRIISNSPQVLEGYLGLNGALSNGSLSPQTRERIALAVAELNSCDYCLAAHTFIGTNLAKLSAGEIEANRRGNSNVPTQSAAVEFAVKIVQKRGQISDSDLLAVQSVGFSDSQVIEIIAHVALNTFTNYINSVLKTEVDFPPAHPLVK